MLPRECYLCQPGADQIMAESNEYWKIKETKVENGIYIYIENALFPLKGYPNSQNLFATNQVKALFFETLQTLSWRLLLVNKQKAVDSFNRIGWKMLSPYLLKWQYVLPFSRALHLVVFTFLLEVGIAETSADQFATLFAHIIETDCAYRYRMQDIFTEMAQGKSLKEIQKLVKERDVVPQGYTLIKLLRLALLVPSIRKAYTKAIKVADFKTLVFDEGDRYWAAKRRDYKYPVAKELTWTYPNSNQK